MLLISINKDSPVPVYQQIIGRIRQLIDSGAILAGEILPPSRVLAEKMGINRSTVTNAYEELTALGYLKSSPGSYTRVCRRQKVADIESKSSKSRLDWRSLSEMDDSSLIGDFGPAFQPEKKDDIIDFNLIDFDRRLMPIQDFTRCIRSVLSKNNSALLSYGHPYGYYPLRESIAERLKKHSISVTPDEIIITNGAQEALNLICLIFSKTGKKAAVESPTYAKFLNLLKIHEIDASPVPMKTDGLDLKILNERLKEGSIGFLYTIPDFQNPTGISTSQKHREELLALCEQYNVPIIEDGFDEEMKYWGKVTLPVKSMDRNGIVLYVGTFSKILSPGLRVGWIAAPEECIRRIGKLRETTSICGNILSEAALDEFCRRGYYEQHLIKTNRVFKRRMKTALEAMEKEINRPDIQWDRPMGGFLIWLVMNNIVQSADSVIPVLLKHGVKASSGDQYFTGRPPKCCLRLNLSKLNEDEIREGIRRLSLALKELYSINNKLV